jgi:adenine-specific DNA-methyltransferase
MSNRKNSRIESRRIKLQTDLDGKRTRQERNKLGQVSTPPKLARELAAHALALLPQSMPLRFLEPGCNLLAISSAVIEKLAGRSIQSATGIEIDPHYANPAKKLWRGTPIKIILGDFTRLSPPTNDIERATLLICNPPYVRNQHIDSTEKKRMQRAIQDALGIKFSGLSGLYCYFVALAHDWLCEGGVAVWIIPSEFMESNYGRALMKYLLRHVTLLQIHRFDPNDAQFKDALVSSAVVSFRKAKPPANHKVRFSFGGTLLEPTIIKDISTQVLARTDKWTRYPEHKPQRKHRGWLLGDLFTIKRGINTGANDFFIVDETEVRSRNLPMRYLRQILPRGSDIDGNEIHANLKGSPLLGNIRLYVIDCDLSEEGIARAEPELWTYLQTGMPDVAQGYTCRKRKLWYKQEIRTPAPIVCSYAGRTDKNRRPFRFFLNHSTAIATNNLYMLYPKQILGRRFMGSPERLRPIWQALNAMGAKTFLAEGRCYGGGLHKMEPGEFAKVPADTLARVAGLPAKSKVRRR